MRKRLYFTVPDAASARRIRDELLLARIGDENIHVMAKPGVPLAGMNEASVLQTSDFVHGAETGLAVGGGIGIIAGLVAVFYPPAGVDLQLVTILLTALIGAAFGAWVASMVASSIPNSRLKRFESAINAGHILMLVDVPAGRVDEISKLVDARHPEAMGSGVEPTIPAFP